MAILSWGTQGIEGNRKSRIEETSSLVLVIVADDFDYRIKWMEVQGSREGRGEGDYGIRCTATLKLCTPSPSRSLPRLEAPAKSLGRSVPGGPPSRPQGFR